MAKTIKAVFGVGECTKVCPQWQYDYNTVLQFVGLDLPANYEVDLSNSKTGQSTTVLGDENGCVIPAQYFIPGSSIFAWVFVAGSDYGFTRAQVEIPISPRAQHTGDPPTPAQQDALDAAIALLNETVEGIPTAIDTALAEAKASGEFDGADGTDGNNAWTVDAENTRISGNYVQIPVAYLVGPSGATAKAGDVVFISDGRMTQISRIVGQRADTTLIGNLHGDPGEDGYSPEVTITEITGGHRVTITDEDHPEGQSFDVMDGEQGPAGPSGGQFWTATSAYTSPDYTWAISSLTGPTDGTPAVGDLVYYSAYRYTITSIDTTAGTVNCTIRASIRGSQGPAGQGVPVGGTTGQVLKKKSGTDYDTEWANESGGGGGTSDYTDLTNKPQINGHTLSGNQSAADLGLGTYSKPSGGIPKTDLASAVQTSLGKADTALQSAPVTSVNNQTGAVTLSIPSTAADVGAIPAPASPSSAQDLVYLNGAWVAADKVYIVNCTPTALDYSGTMDHTVAEIYAADQAGKTIMFRVYTSASAYLDAVATFMWKGTNTYPSYNAFIIMSDRIVFVDTGMTNDGTKNTYATSIYDLSTSPCIPAPSSASDGQFLTFDGNSNSWVATTVPSAQGVSF